MLGLAAVAFLGGHFLLSMAAVRRALIESLGRPVFLGIYGVYAAVTLIWLNRAYGRAPYQELWGDPLWARYLVIIFMPLAAVLLVCGALTPMPASLLGDTALAKENPAPGIIKITRHPVMWAIALWAALHLIANGDGASAILFATLLILALGGMAHMEARRGAENDANWQRLCAVTSVFPLAAVLDKRARVDLGDIGWWRLGIAVGFYFVLLFGHGWAIDIRLIPELF